jgi:hypothetical protein
MMAILPAVDPAPCGTHWTVLPFFGRGTLPRVSRVKLSETGELPCKYSGFVNRLVPFWDHYGHLAKTCDGERVAE